MKDNNEKLNEAFLNIDSAYIEKAAKPPKRKRKAIIAAILVAALLTGALLSIPFFQNDRKSGEPAVGTEGSTAPDINEDLPYEMQCLDLMEGIVGEDVAIKNPDEAFINSQMRFSLKLFQESITESKDQNVLISPLSVMLALSMTANGSNGETKAELENVLGGGITAEDMNAYLKGYIKELAKRKNTKLQIANSVWFKDSKDFQANPIFLQTVADYYGADIFKAPFDNTTVKDINHWICENTDGLIEKMLDELEPDTVMCLINTLFFEAEWNNQYSNYSVSKDTFTSISGQKKEVELMYANINRYLQDDNALGFTVYYEFYEGLSFEFVALLPNEGVDIYDYIAGLTPEGLLTTLSNVHYHKTETWLPKFDYEYSLDMKNTLQSMGISSAFNAASADFSGLGTSSWGPLYINNILHKTHITVNEHGTKVGASTVISASGGSGPSFVVPKIIKLDRPFVYMIIDNTTNLPIFMGAVMDIGK